jgi:lysophospholipase L1-like esterase
MKPPSIISIAITLFLAGCSTKDEDPFAGRDGSMRDSRPATAGPDAVSGTGGIAGTAGASGASGAGGGSGGAPGGLAPTPARMIVLGDSIVACSNVGGKMGADCSVKKLFDYVKATYAVDLLYENGAVGGAVTVDVPTNQLPTVRTGPGHALVLIYIGGNDLGKSIFVSDATAQSNFAVDLPMVMAAWDQIFAFFGDRTKFPDGYTMLMNNQYNPFDDCTALPYNVSATKIGLLHMFNEALAKVAQSKGASFTDQFTSYLGHGHHYRVMTCPHYMAGATAWMDDLIHPNVAGHTNIFEQWQKTVDGLYRP